jgi:hypothetical protein
MMKEQIKRIMDNEYSSAVSLIIFAFLCMLMLPIMIIRNFNRIKTLGVITTLLNVLFLLYALSFYIVDRIEDANNGTDWKHLPPVAEPKDYDSPWPFAPKTAFAFEY